MLKQSSKYFFIASINAAVLTILLAGWTDKLELVLNTWVRPMEFLKIVAFSIASLLAMWIAVPFFGARAVEPGKAKIKIASFLTLLVSSYLYIDYADKLLTNRVIYRSVRKQAVAKVERTGVNATKANDLTIGEYRQIFKSPKIPDQATSISYSYEYDGLLPDYYFHVTYTVPKTVKVDTLSLQRGDFTRSQTVERSGDNLLVTYTEIEQ